VPFDDLNRWFKTASVFVSMSHIEAMPITPLEVMSAGARFVASDIDAHREIASVTGGGVYLVDRDAKPQVLAERVLEAMNAERVEATVLSWDEVMDRTLEVYGTS
jgi:glycosyltransferase involved in cell wall biosynthesis